MNKMWSIQLKGEHHKHKATQVTYTDVNLESPSVAEKAKIICIMKSAVVWGKRSTSLPHLLPRNNSLGALRHGFSLCGVQKESGGTLWVRTPASCLGTRVILVPSRRPWQQEKLGMGMSSLLCVCPVPAATGKSPPQLRPLAGMAIK